METKIILSEKTVTKTKIGKIVSTVDVLSNILKHVANRVTIIINEVRFWSDTGCIFSTNPANSAKFEIYRYGFFALIFSEAKKTCIRAMIKNAIL